MIARTTIRLKNKCHLVLDITLEFGQKGSMFLTATKRSMPEQVQGLGGVSTFWCHRSEDSIYLGNPRVGPGG